MASRYTDFTPVDYCYNPIHVVDPASDKDIIVPCGKCDGCLLHKANEWSMRCGMEIESSPATIFGTLTYDNKYLPKLYPVYDRCGDRILKLWVSDHAENVRFNSVRDVRREDGIVINHPYDSIPIQKWDNENRPAINYMSKRDVQLWLKLLRKDLLDYGIYPTKRIQEFGFFRYFIISEVGPTTFRSHAHFLLFCQSVEVSSYLLECSLYKNWQMCDENRFCDYTHLCDSGARGYVTQYLTSSTELPRVYQKNTEIRPFRLASKSPGIGFVEQDKEKIFRDVERGIIKYTRPVPRLDSQSLLLYPSNYTRTLFPKCYRFNKVFDSRRDLVYGFLYRAIRKTGQEYSLCSSRLREIMHSSDYLATCACYRYCLEYHSCPEHYLFMLDMYYYQVDMERLRSFYRSQEEINYLKDPEIIFEYYSNLEQILLTTDFNISDNLSVFFLFSDLGLNVFDYNRKEVFTRIKKDIRYRNRVYRLEVSDIVDNMVKMPKFNELTGNSPTIV